MRRYIARTTRPAAYYDEDAPFLLSLTVFEPDAEPVDTGLIDQHGATLYAIDEREPIGFVALKVRG